MKHEQEYCCFMAFNCFTNSIYGNETIQKCLPGEGTILVDISASRSVIREGSELDDGNRTNVDRQEASVLVDISSDVSRAAGVDLDAKLSQGL